MTDYRAIGSDQLRSALPVFKVPDLVEQLGIFSLSALIEEVLDRHYPADIFGDGEKLYPTWASEHGGDDIDTGVKWVALLRWSIREALGE